MEGGYTDEVKYDDKMTTKEQKDKKGEMTGLSRCYELENEVFLQPLESIKYTKREKREQDRNINDAKGDYDEERLEKK